MTPLGKILPFLETYKGRDRLLRLLSYSSKCAAGLIKSEGAAFQLDQFSKQLSTSRACFRLLDDIPLLADIISNCSSKKEQTTFDKILFAIESFVDMIFGPLDHICWAIDHKIIVSDSTFWDVASTWCWIISLYINIYKVVMRLSVLSRQKLEINDPKERKLRKKLSVDQWYLEMSALKCLIDLTFAVNYLPKGTLWAQSLDKWQVGALGSVSSAVGLYQALML